MYSKKIMLTLLCAISYAQGMQGTISGFVSTAGDVAFGAMRTTLQNPVVLAVGCVYGLSTMIPKTSEEITLLEMAPGYAKFEEKDSISFTMSSEDIAKFLLASAFISMACGIPCNNPWNATKILLSASGGLLLGRTLGNYTPLCLKFEPVRTAIVGHRFESPGIVTFGAAVVAAGLCWAGKSLGVEPVIK